MTEKTTENTAPLIDPTVAVNLGLEETPPEKAKTETKKKKKAADMGGFYWGTGRRKSSVARVRIKKGKGKILINKRQVDKYFVRKQDVDAVVAPLKAVEVEKTFDIFVNVKGGGTTGQSGAVKLGIARALIAYDDNMMQKLRDVGHLTRDSRMVERKKPGKPGARKSFQFSKR